MAPRSKKAPAASDAAPALPVEALPASEAPPVGTGAEPPVTEEKAAELAEQAELLVRGLWHDGREAAAIRTLAELLGLDDLDEARALAEKLAAKGPPPADYRLPVEEAPRSLEDSIVPAAGGTLHHLPTPRLAVVPPEPVKKPTGRRSLGTSTLTLEVALTPEERLTAAVALAQLEITIPALEAEHKVRKAAMKAEMGELEGQRHKLAQAVREGREARELTVERWINHDDGVIETFDADGKLLSTSPIGAKHKQLQIGDTVRDRQQDAAGDHEGSEEADPDGEEGSEPEGDGEAE
jgi:hypothetical protein